MRTILLLIISCSTALGQPSISGSSIFGLPVGYVRPLGTAQSKLGVTTLNITANLVPGETAIATVAYDSNVLLTNIQYELQFGRVDVTNRIGTTAANVSCGIASVTPTTFPSSGNIQITFSGSVAAVAMTAYAVRGNLALDLFSTNSGTGTTPSSNATGLATTPNQFLVAVVALEGPNTDAVGVWNSAIINGQNGGTAGGGDASNCSITDGYLLVSSPGRSNLGSKTGMASRDWAAAVAMYKFR